MAIWIKYCIMRRHRHRRDIRKWLVEMAWTNYDNKI